MRFTADYVGSKKHIHFFGDSDSLVTRSLKIYAQRHNIPTSSGAYPTDKTVTDVYIINKPSQAITTNLRPNTLINYIFTSHTPHIRKIGQSLIDNDTQRKKVIYLDSDTGDNDVVEKIIWFTMLESAEDSIFIRTDPITNNDTQPHKSIVRRTKNRFPKRYIFLMFALSQIAFIIPLLVSVMFLYGSITSFRNNETTHTTSRLLYAQKTIGITQSFYAVAKPLFSFLYIDSHIDNTIDSLKLVQSIMSKTQVSIQNGTELMRLVTAQADQNNDSQIVDFRVRTLTSQINDLSKDVDNLSIKLAGMPFVPDKSKKELKDRSKTLKQLQGVLVLLPTILAKDTERNLIIFFYNNMELRPGGGFMGSYALVNIKNYHISPITVFDVYDADGQLKEHIQPPEEIKKYLNQPHWFLRDSNFNPDFVTNAEMAQYFLSKEMPDNKQIDSFIGITTTAVSSLLSSFPPIYLKDFNETIGSDNFIVKSQEEIESSRSSGSKTKKSYISAVTKNLLLNTDKVSPAILLRAISENLHEKQIVIHDNNEAISNLIESNGWGGRQQIPNCLNNKQCHVNYISAIDANLGVNKTNYYLTRQIRITNSVTDPSTLKTEYIVVFNNQSPIQEFPGGTYKNYFQLFTPSDSQNVSVYLNGKLSNDWTSKVVGNFTITGQYLTVPVSTSTTLKITYTQPIPKKTDTYQLVVQKQIGSINNEMSMIIDNQGSVRKIVPINFTAVEKSGSLLYNSNLTSDKVFIMNF